MDDVQFLQRLRFLSEEIESCTDPAARERMRGVVHILLDFHRRGLARVMQHLGQSGDHGRAIIDALSRDDLVSSLLLLHDLHPSDLNTRLKQVIESGAPHWAAQGATVELLGVTPDGMLKLKVVRTGQGWPSSTTALRTSIEQAFYAAAPDAAGVSVEGLEDPSGRQGFVPLSAVRIRKAV